MPALNFNLHFQHHLNWCWAAVSLAVRDFYGVGAPNSQCLIVNAILGRGDCCNWAGRGPWIDCNQTSALPPPLTLVGHDNGSVGRPATWAEVQGEIDGNRPIAIRLGWLLGGGHFINITGYYNLGVANVMLVKDPTFGVSIVPVATFPLGYWGSLGAWTDTYWTN